MSEQSLANFSMPKILLKLSLTLFLMMDFESPMLPKINSTPFGKISAKMDEEEYADHVRTIRKERLLEEESKENDWSDNE